VGLGAVLQKPVQRLGQIADLQGWHGHAHSLRPIILLTLHA
jgi:hypothetical protein